MWVKHTTSIPHESTGQTIIERAHCTLKEYLNKQKQPEENDPTVTLHQVLLTLNFISVTGEQEHSIYSNTL